MLVDMVIDGIDMPEGEPIPVDSAGDLIRRVAHGDRDAFTELYRMLSPRAFGLILRILVDRAQSEEVLQEVFLEVWQSASRFSPKKGQGRSWLLTIAHRRAIDRVRAAQASSDRDRRAGLRDLVSTAASIDEQVEIKVETERIAGALRTLPDMQREVMILAYYGGYSQSEIAVLTGSPLGTVKTRMRDGLTRLRKEMR